MTVEEFVKNITHLGHASIKFKINGKIFILIHLNYQILKKLTTYFQHILTMIYFSEEDNKKDNYRKYNNFCC